MFLPATLVKALKFKKKIKIVPSTPVLLLFRHRVLLLLLPPFLKQLFVQRLLCLHLVPQLLQHLQVLLGRVVDSANHHPVLEHFGQQQIISEHQQHQGDDLLPVRGEQQKPEFKSNQGGLEHAQVGDKLDWLFGKSLNKNYF